MERQHIRHGGTRLALAGLAAMIGAVAAPAQTVVVPGGADPFLAGQPAGTSCCGGDGAPGQSPVLAGAFSAGQTLTFSTTGGVNFNGGAPAPGADGDNDGTNYTARANMAADFGTGLSGPKQVNIDGLVGVFIGDGVPSGVAPAQLDFSGSGSASGLDFLSLAPGLNQIFWIGDGLTGIGSGTLQQFLVPTGATRLYLGTVDGGGWYNNSGTITVTIDASDGGSGAVPEPASWALMLGGFGLVGATMRARRKPVAFA